MNAPDLHVHSTFSLRDGMGMPDAVVERAKELGWGAAAITEHGWLGSAPTFYLACKEAKVNPIIGCEMYVIPFADKRDDNFHLTVLALSVEGYHNLVAWTSFAMQRENFHRKPKITLEEMVDAAPYSLHHNVVLSGCLGSELVQTVLNANGNALGAGTAYVQAAKSLFPNFYVEIQDHHIGKYAGRGYEAYDGLLERESVARKLLVEIARGTKTPLVLTNDSHFQTPDQRKAHLALKANDYRGRDEAHYGKSKEHLIEAYLPEYVYFGSYMRSMEKIADGIGNCADEAIRSAIEIAAEADIRLDPLDHGNYSIPFSGYEDPLQEIRDRCAERLEGLVPEHGRKRVYRRFDRELAAMGDFAHYLLLMSDFLLNAKRQGILTNTRGSAAASLVCYALSIHEYDPIHYGLLFERFVNPARKGLPDIDIDIEKDRYEDFMRFVVEHMENLEGEGQCIPICNYGTFANRAAFRAAADAMGMDKEEQDNIAKLLPQMIDSGMVDEETDAYEAIKEDFPELYDTVSGVFDNFKSVGQHACGWVFGTKDRPLGKWVPRYLIVSSNTEVAQYDFKTLKKIGLIKGDFLRLKTLSVIKRTLLLVGKSATDLEQIPLDDSETFETIRRGDTEGVFTLQGKDNRRAAMEIESTNVHDVIKAVALARPSLTRDGYDKSYNRRRLGKEEYELPTAVEQRVLGDTFGIPIFQEQVMQIGYELGMDDLEAEEILEAIKLAKGVGRGAKEAFEEIKPMFYKYAEGKMGKEEADGLWTRFSSFKGYGFNMAHSTSYGVLAVRAAYLRTHFPREFYSALLDVYPEKHKYVASARGAGFTLLPPSINASQGGFSPGDGDNEIRVGLSRVKGLGPAAVREIVGGQPFTSLDDLRERTDRRALNKARLEALTRVGALDELGVRKTGDDVDEFELLGFTLSKPQAFRGCKPRHVSPRDSGNWKFEGRKKGVEYTQPRHSIAKLFWIPPELKDKKANEKIYEKKASAWAMVKTHLLLVVDENGLPFHIMANEDKEGEIAILDFLASKCRGAVVCLEGAIRSPFATDGPLGFRFYSVAGGYSDDPQLWGVDRKYVLAVSELERRKRKHRQAMKVAA